MEGNVLSAVLGVFDQVSAWFTTAITNAIPIFYAEGQLTLIGVLSVASLAIAVILMVLAMIRSYLRFQ